MRFTDLEFYKVFVEEKDKIVALLTMRSMLQIN
jgi:hypothetical protein